MTLLIWRTSPSPSLSTNDLLRNIDTRPVRIVRCELVNSKCRFLVDWNFGFFLAVHRRSESFAFHFIEKFLKDTSKIEQSIGFDHHLRTST